MIRIAAAGDLHYGRNSAGFIVPYLKDLAGAADCLLLAGDLTQIGSAEESEILARDLRLSPVPVIAVLGNHDFHSDDQDRVIQNLSDAGVRVLEQSTCILTLGSLGNVHVGVVGLKGFGGGFLGACGADFGEPEMKAFVRTTKRHADRLRLELDALNADYRIVLMHYSPCADTLAGEKREIFPFLGSYLLAEAIDEGGADLIFHGHAHHGVEKGFTPGGIPVRNVAQPVIRHAFNIYTLNKDEGVLHTGGRGEGYHHGARPAEANKARAAEAALPSST